ncbi:site-specific integrase [candidate division KSB1 bacterium]|nr:site-specific integrase [candidate division KSB1 bacterium]
MSKRHKTDYPGVFYREAKRIGGKGTEKIYYIVFKKEGKLFEEKAGRQHQNNMTPAKAATIRGERIEGKRMSRKEIKTEERALQASEADKWTVSGLWDAYKENRSIKGIVTDQNRYENYIKPNFGNKEPKDILPMDVDRVRLKLLKKKAPGTVKNVLELLRRIVNFGIKKNLCPGLNFTIEMPRVDNEKTEDLTPEQLQNLLIAIDEDFHPHAGPMMKLALFTGMRRGEMFKLKWSDIDFERGFISLVDPKGGPDQKIPLNDGARTLLGVTSKTTSPYVFPGRSGRLRTDINKAVNAIKKEAGLPKDFRPLHGLRHVYASMLASSGEVDLYTLQKLLTHKDPKMTMRYSHLRDGALKRASELAGTIIEQAAVIKKIKSLF